ncbi:MAG: AMP-binding protein [Candidatus Sericytochromatia bacterium]|nr:AMP-binding protein [Candidatus Tanganyikabacteria bacterium]
MTHLRSPLPLGPMEPSLGAMLADRARRWPDRTAYQERGAAGAFVPLAWPDLHDRIRRAGSWLLSAGVGKGDRVATLSRNSADMLVWELAIMSCGALSVPIFARYGPDQIAYLLEHSGARMLLVGDELQLERAREARAPRLLDALVLSGPAAGANAGGTGALTFDEVLAHPVDPAFDEAVRGLGPQEPCLVMYTSGTTGQPKGVVLVHGNILSQQKALEALWRIAPGDVFLSYLPWHHSFGGLFERFTALAQGATLSLDDSEGRDIPRLVANWREIMPTHFFSVPKVYQALVTECRLNPEVEGTVFHPGLKFVFTAAAPLPKDCSDYFARKGIPVLEGWGLTETSPCVTLTSPDGVRVPGIVGMPLPGVEVRIAEEREIHVRGPNVMRGYFHDPERTARVLGEDGWLRTGDLGEVTEGGLRIICRLDGVFKLSNGEKVPSAQVEAALTATSRFIEQAVVLGAGHDYVGALVFPNVRNLTAWAREHGLADLPLADLLAEPAVASLFATEVDERNATLEPGYLRVRAFSVVPHELSIEAGELTPSLKVVRSRVAELQRPLVEAIYAEDGDPDLQCRVVRLARPAVVPDRLPEPARD